MSKILPAALLLGACLTYSPAALAQTDQEASLFAGFSLSSAAVADAESGEAYGLELDYTYFLDRRFGFTLSAAGHWGNLEAPPNIFGVGTYDARQYTFLAGPHVVLWRGLTSEAGIRALAGVATRSLEADFFGTNLDSETVFAWGASINFDWRITDGVWVRLPQVGIIFTEFDLDDGAQGDFRVAFGLVIRAGELLQ